MTETVVLIPGILGTTLSLNGAQVWQVPAPIAAEALRFPDAHRPLVPGELVACYRPLATRLRRGGFDVRIFAYDWRQSVADSAARLQEFVAHERLDRFHVVAHSMGGLVARSWI